MTAAPLAAHSERKQNKRSLVGSGQRNHREVPGTGGAAARHLDKEGSLQRLGQVVVTAEQGELLRGAQLPSQHSGFLQLLQLLPGAEQARGSQNSSRHFLPEAF